METAPCRNAEKSYVHKIQSGQILLRTICKRDHVHRAVLYRYLIRITELLCQDVRMPAASSKGAPKNPSELKDDTNSSRGEKQV
jgi:hypothetical protein